MPIYEQGGGGATYDQSLNTTDNVEFTGFAINETPITGKFTVNSNFGSYGQFQLINPDTGEVTIVFANNSVAAGDGGITSSSGDYLWAFGLGSYGGSPNTFYFGNNLAGGHVFSIAPNGNTVIAGDLVAKGIAKQLFQGFTTSVYDTAIPTFSGDVLTLFTLKSGGVDGTTVNVVEYNYTGELLTSKVLKASDEITVLNTYTFSYSGSTLTSKVLT